MTPTLLKGGLFTDARGTLKFVNDDNPGNYKRFYLITHPATTIVRAWQGHKIEEKAFYVISGAFTIAVVTPQNFESPEEKETLQFFKISSDNQNLLRVPGGNYTGIKATTPGSTLLVLSGLGLNESKNDDYRQPENKWVDWSSVL